MAFARHLIETVGVAAVPGSPFCPERGETKLRFTSSKKDETLHEACRRLEELGRTVAIGMVTGGQAVRASGSVPGTDDPGQVRLPQSGSW